jgi:hypothetical protein
MSRSKTRSAATARNSFVGIEHLTDEELDDIRARCERLAKAEKISERVVQLTGGGPGRPRIGLPIKRAVLRVCIRHPGHLALAV